jgi:UDP-N-acetylmuramoyl-L-alanyl-D-glutamate--2,6-diaminopimelate ligase
MSKCLGSLLEGLEVQSFCGDIGINVEGISYDSRNVNEGDLFVAVPGTRQDGGKFIRDALQKGARVVVAENVPQGIEESICFVKVSNSRKALAELAANFYEHPSKDLQLIGVTGTNGKTTTTLLLEAILKHSGFSVGVLGTLSYRWADKHRKASMTTPESLDLQRLFSEMRQDKVSHVVMEVSSHALALGRVKGCTFRAGIFTNLSQDHLDFHPTMEDYFSAKALLFQNGTSGMSAPLAAVINTDDPYGRRLIEDAASREVWSYSVNSSDARVWVKTCELSPSGIKAEFSTPEGLLMVRSPLIGRLNLYNLLCAATTALSLGIPKTSISEGLRTVCCVDGRLQRVAIPPEAGFEVVVDYAHTPDAMEKTLGCLKEMTKGRLLGVFGCGGNRDRKKRPLMGMIGAQLADVVVLTSDNPRNEDPESIIKEIEPGVQGTGISFFDPGTKLCPDRGYTVEADRKKAIQLALSWSRPGDTVFIGGKGHETYQIIGDRVFPFDDRLVVEDYFKSQTDC